MASIDTTQRKAAGSQNRSGTPTPKPRAEASDESKLGKAKGEGKGEEKDKLKGLNEAVCRANFLKKVYGILTVQLFVTVAMAATCMYVEQIRVALVIIFNQYESTLRWGLFIPTLVSLLVLKCGAKDRYPWNYFWLSAFTLCISINVGYVCAVFEAGGLGDLVLQAFGLTSVIFLGLTLYTLYSGVDFGFLKAFLSVALWGLSLTIFLAICFPGLTESLAFGFVGALTFCGYILYDTSLLMTKLSYDDYILATIELYLDFINLFLYILDILVKLTSKNEKKKN
jgi:FtsH-binding integral membrane protein